MKTTTSHLKEIVMQGVFTACACISILAVALICIFLFANGLPTIFEIGPLKFLLGTTWKPGNNLYGILPMILGSIYVTAGAIIVGVPIGLLTAIYMSRFASPRINKVLLPAVQLLAGIPSVVYGFFGMIIIRPFIAQLTGGLGFGALTAWFVLAIMIVPTITTLTIDALNSIPMGIREASYAMGATKWQTIYKVVLPAAKLGIVDAIVLGMGRAIGETMAVLMVVGNAPVIPDSIASPISTLTSQIALDMSYSSGLHRSALFGMGVVLFIISATLVGIVRLISKKKRG